MVAMDKQLNVKNGNETRLDPTVSDI